jgi:hypothetical protein
MTEHASRVAELKTAVEDAKQRVAEFDAARQAGARRVERARAELMEFYRRQGRGDESEVTDLAMGRPLDDDRETDLINALREAEGGLRLRAGHYPQEGNLPDVALEAVDDAAEARYEGARELLAEREVELRQYVALHLTELVVERTPIAGAIRNQCAAMLDEARGIGDAWERFRSQTVELLNLADREDLIAEIADNPMRGLRDLQEVPLPMPTSFTG